MLPMVKAKYLARACGAASFAPSSKGNQQIAVPMEVVDGEYAGETITWIATFHDTADKNGVTGTERVLESLVFMGWQTDELSDLVEISDEDAKRMLPNDVEIVCEPDTYDGKTNLKVKWVNKPGAGRFAFKEAVSKNDLRSFSAQLKSTVRSVRGAGGQRPANGSGAKPVHPNAPGGGNDDIPFATADMDHEPSPIAKVLR